MALIIPIATARFAGVRGMMFEIQAKTKNHLRSQLSLGT
jgi:hypothetical protein